MVPIPRNRVGPIRGNSANQVAKGLRLPRSVPLEEVLDRDPFKHLLQVLKTSLARIVFPDTPDPAPDYPLVIRICLQDCISQDRADVAVGVAYLSIFLEVRTRPDLIHEPLRLSAIHDGHNNLQSNL